MLRNSQEAAMWAPSWRMSTYMYAKQRQDKERIRAWRDLKQTNKQTTDFKKLTVWGSDRNISNCKGSFVLIKGIRVLLCSQYESNNNKKQRNVNWIFVIQLCACILTCCKLNYVLHSTRILLVKKSLEVECKCFCNENKLPCKLVKWYIRETETRHFIDHKVFACICLHAYSNSTGESEYYRVETQTISQVELQFKQ